MKYSLLLSTYKMFHYRTNTTSFYTPYSKYMVSIQVCVCVSDRSSGLSTWKVRSMTVVHCRQRMMNVLALGRSVFISWHSGHIQRESQQRNRHRYNHLSLSVRSSSTTLHTLSREQQRTLAGALGFTLHTLASKHYTSSFKSDGDGFEPLFSTNSIHVYVGFVWTISWGGTK